MYLRGAERRHLALAKKWASALSFPCALQSTNQKISNVLLVDSPSSKRVASSLNLLRLQDPDSDVSQHGYDLHVAVDIVPVPSAVC